MLMNVIPFRQDGFSWLPQNLEILEKLPFFLKGQEKAGKLRGKCWKSIQVRKKSENNFVFVLLVASESDSVVFLIFVGERGWGYACSV